MHAWWVRIVLHSYIYAPPRKKGIVKKTIDGSIYVRGATACLYDWFPFFEKELGICIN